MTCCAGLGPEPVQGVTIPRHSHNGGASTRMPIQGENVSTIDTATHLCGLQATYNGEHLLCGRDF